jgi:3-hydroxyisobutyrate dehydrogenase-like beta-hydroxyacid dehydrogenase
MDIAFLGTGLMGAPMAARLLGRGHRVYVWNRTPVKTRGLAEAGAVAAGDARGAVSPAGCVILMLADKNAVDQAVFSDAGVPLEGKTVIQMGTIAPDESRAFQDEVIRRGGEYLECPVLGSRKEAREGTLILMAGSTPEQFERWRPLLETLGRTVRRAGEVGQAAVLKLALNQLIAAHAVSFSFSLGLVQAYNVDVGLFRDVLKQSTLSAPMFERKLPNWLKRDFGSPNFPARHMLKDIRLIRRAAESRNISVEHIDAIGTIFERALLHGAADQDYSSVINEIAPVSS